MKPQHKAHYLGNYKGKRVHCFPVHYTIGEYAVLAQRDIYPKGIIDVVSDSAAAAADYAANLLGKFSCVELTVLGPKGGKACHRYWGFDRAIFNQLLDRPANNQFPLPFTVQS